MSQPPRRRKPEDDLPPPPPGFTLDRAIASAPRLDDAAPPPPPQGFQLDQPTGEAVDGDTLRMVNGGNLRLFGIDAPESKQLGWDRNGQAVPIGQNSRVALDAITTPQAIPGPQMGSSYGRPVAPVTDNGLDLGQEQIRSGNALAAPSFMEQDTARRFRYMQAERLARLNRQGLHNTFSQTPQEFRRDPIIAPRETVAQFWDTPTPDAGMRPEDEAKYVELLRTSNNADEIVAFARGAGREINPADVEKWLKDRAEWKAKGRGELPAYANYVDAPKVMTDQGDGAAGAGARGFANGVLPNMLEETGAVVDMLGGTNNRENVWNSDRRWADIYHNNLEQNEAITRFDRFEHPYVTTGSEIAGGLVVPIGRVRTAADLAKFGAGYGAVSGLGREGTIPERLTSGIVGAGEGAIVTTLGGKALEAASPYVGKGLRYAGEKFGIIPPRSALDGAPRLPDRIDVGPSPNPAETQSPVGPDGLASSVTAPPPRLPGERAPDWIDVGSVPPPPPGYRLDQPTATAGRGQDQIDPERLRTATPEQKQALADFQNARQTGIVPNSDDIWRAANGAAERVKAEQRQSIGMNADAAASITSETPRQRDYLFPERPYPISQPVSDAQRATMAETVAPGDILPIPSNQVGSIEEAARIDAGRYAQAKPVNEATALGSRTIRTPNGREVQKRGPLDLVTWLRTQGGIRDQGGNLRAMGIDNAPRDLDFARGEQRLGRLIDDGGMTLDEAAYRAWREGYLPGNERPDINTLLDAIDRTHSGAARFYHPDDLAEVARFEGMRADRQQLDEQLADGPVFVDRSSPAAEPQPFPPAQAYEEWPAGGPDFAGNIDLRKLDSPQDISRALDFTNRRVGFDAATRGRVAQAETERLAGDLGMTPDQLLSRRKGQAFNAEEALAARQILAKSGNELVNMAKRIGGMENPGDDMLAKFRQAWLRHAAIQEQVSGMTAEAGRTLSQFRMLANSRAVPGDVLTAMVGNGGGRQRMIDAANTLLETVETDPGKFRAVVEAGAKPRLRDKLNEVWINSLLSGPQTHAVNMASNTLTALAQIPEHAAASLVGNVRRLGPKASPDRIDMSEVGARAFGLIQGAKEGARLFARSLRTGEPSDFVSKVEGQNTNAISGLKGEVVRIPTRLLGAEDEFFKGIARRMELNGLAVRQARAERLTGKAAKARIADLVANPTDEMLERSMDYARYVTFQNKLGPYASKISALSNEIPGAKLFLPFVRTPTNLLKFAAERSPFAPMLKEWRGDFTAGGARRDLAVAKMMVGTGFGAAVYQAALSGQITGSAPPDPAKAKLLYADGWQPYSIRVGDKWYSYKRLDPFSTTLGTAADLALLPEGMNERQRDDKATLLVASIMGNLASKTWLSGISDIVGVLDDPGRNADNFVQRLAGSMAVPNIVAQTARTMDPTAREVDSVGEAIQARIPGLSDNLMPKRDVWGQPVTNEGGIGPDIVSPIWQSTIKNDPVNRELLGIPYAPGKPRNVVGGRKLSPAEFDRYQAEVGSRSHAALSQLVASPEWKSLDPEARQALAEKTVRAAREEAKAVLFDASTNGRKAPPRLPAPPPPAGFTADGAAGGVNVYADLLKIIPGMKPGNFTSGFRTPEYQADMRRRGYKPAWNSGHLDGTSLDMVPPPGKSFAWLKDQVRSYRPDAHLLIHDGHLHATFPGYYGAPVLGGAKRAGIRNPNAGMPPPPPGFKLD